MIYAQLLTVLLGTATPPPALDPALFAANVICGEAGNDEALGMLIAHVIDHRIDRTAASRAEQLLAVLREPSQFAGRCRIDMPRWALLLGTALRDDTVGQIWRPRWMNTSVRWFTERHTAQQWLRHKHEWSRDLWLVGTFHGVCFFASGSRHQVLPNKAKVHKTKAKKPLKKPMCKKLRRGATTRSTSRGRASSETTATRTATQR